MTLIIPNWLGFREKRKNSIKYSITTTKAAQRGIVAFPSTSTSSAADALRSIFLFCLSLAGGRTQDHSLREGFLLLIAWRIPKHQKRFVITISAVLSTDDLTESTPAAHLPSLAKPRDPNQAKPHHKDSAPSLI